MPLYPETILSHCHQQKELLISVRRHLHQHPELSGQEEKTIDYLSGLLSSFGLAPQVVERGGVLALIPGGKAPKEGRRPTILLRADCDALPVTEQPHDGLPRTCVSHHPGICHACGHDAHSAILVTAAKVLWEMRSDLPGDVLLMVERSEEVPYNRCLLRLMEAIEQSGRKIDGVWGLHCSPSPAGEIQLNDGATMSGTLFFDFTLQGLGGHGSRPDLCHNPVDCFAAIHQALGQLPVRLVSPFLPSSLAVTYVQGGAKNNVIAQQLAFGGTARFFDVETGFALQREINRTVDALAQLYRCSVSGRAAEPFLPLLNHPACVALARQAFENSALAPRVASGLPSMAAETFATLACKYPAVFIHYGIANPEKGIGSGLHTPTFDVDEDCLPDAAAAAVIYATAFLSALENGSSFASSLRQDMPYAEKTAAELFAMQGVRP